MLRFAMWRGNITAIAAVMFAMVSALMLMQYAADGRVAYTTDSLYYRDAALNFLEGHPMQSTNVTTREPERLPLVVWPPAYPALWASVASLTDVDIDDVTSFLNPLLQAVTVLSIFVICRMAAASTVTACIVAAASAFLPSSMAVYGHAWSETLFIPLLLLAYAACWKYRISSEQFIWLAVSAILIGLANWVRYAGVAFLPILWISVFFASSALPVKRVVHATGAMLLGVAVALPLWLHNWYLAGNISGSNRGGPPDSDRWLQDMEKIVELFEHSLFGFDYALLANLKIPLIIATGYVVFRIFNSRGFQWLKVPGVWLPIVWSAGYLLFLLQARMVQAEVPMDLRMLSVAFPFLLIAAVPFVDFSFRYAPAIGRTLALILLGLLINSGMSEADRVRKNYAVIGEPEWRSEFAIIFKDLRSTSPTSRALLERIGPVQSSTLILTDYRAFHLRYLTGASVYAPPLGKDCASWAGIKADVLLLTRFSELTPWVNDCLKEIPKMRLLLPQT